MKNDAVLAYADKVGQFFVTYSSISPMAGRLLGYLLICEPRQQAINDLARALKASRSAIVGAVQVLENRHVVNRTRVAGNRNDLIAFDAVGFEERGFNETIYRQQAALFKEGLELLMKSSSGRSTQLEELIQFAEFLAERMPLLQQEWQKRSKS